MKRLVAGLIIALAVLLMRPAAAQLSGPPDWYTIANAAAANKTDDVAAMVRRGDNPNLIDSFGRTPLGYAAAFGNVPMIKLLLDGGARIDYRDSFGSTALHWAAERGSVEAIKMLLAAKAPVDATNRQGITPLMLAAGANKGEAVRALLEGGADPKKQDFTGRDAKSWAAGKPSALRALQAGHAG
jgi:uncharacterized protein